MQDPASDVKIVLDSVESLDQLQVLLVLAEEPSRYFLPSELLDRTSVRKEDLELVLSALIRKGLASAEEGACRLSPDLRAASGVKALLSQYRRDPAPLLRTLNQRCVERTRAIAAQSHTHSQRLRSSFPPQPSPLPARAPDLGGPKLALRDACGEKLQDNALGAAVHSAISWLIAREGPCPVSRVWLIIGSTVESSGTGTGSRGSDQVVLWPRCDIDAAQ